MFKLNIKSGGKKIAYQPLSVSIKYMIDEKKLKSSFLFLEKVFNLKFSKLQKKNFLVKEGYKIRVTKHEGKPDALILYKVKVDDKFNSDYFRNHLAGLIKDLENEEIKYLHIFVPSYRAVKKYFDSPEYYYQTFVEGLLLGNYTFEKYKEDKKKLKNMNVILYGENEKAMKSAIDKAELIYTGVSFTKDLQNEPSNVLTPAELAAIVRARLSKEKIKVQVFNENEIEKRNMGGLLAVGRGSSNKPRFIVLRYKPSSRGKKKKIKKIALVGKGVTFDTGGVCVKPAQGMVEMKADMSGAAVVAGTMLAAAKAKLPVEILGVIPAAENSISGDAMRPGDVIETASGKTIEIGHTDAEGRMILSDALDYASKQKPDEIIDFATLTGACVVALGQNAAGLFTKDDDLADKLYKTGMKTFDRVWRLPMWDEYHKFNESKIADVNNDGGRWGGAIVAAKFLENFVDKKIPWAHIDIAGPAIASDLNNYTKTYMTGFGVRLMF
ncbi:MAG TPA: leucyl aminopeptidase, partial [Ignavibacteriaceae bacterium]